eukprot:scaffold85555_cov31-Tisochrysis_lutea.AAC.5
MWRMLPSARRVLPWPSRLQQRAIGVRPRHASSAHGRRSPLPSSPLPADWRAWRLALVPPLPPDLERGASPQPVRLTRVPAAAPPPAVDASRRPPCEVAPRSRRVQQSRPIVRDAVPPCPRWTQPVICAPAPHAQPPRAAHRAPHAAMRVQSLLLRALWQPPQSRARSWRASRAMQQWPPAPPPGQPARTAPRPWHGGTAPHSLQAKRGATCLPLRAWCVPRGRVTRAPASVPSPSSTPRRVA